jgi:hypothetical protein
MSPSAPRSTAIPRWLWWTLLASLVGSAGGGALFKGYADRWLRPPPQVSRCALYAARTLKDLEQITGVEPHETPDGGTVWLRPGEDRAVRCVHGSSRTSEQGKKLALAFAELDDEARVRGLVQLVRELPEDPTEDRVAYTVYLAVRGAFDAIPASTPGRAEGRAEIERQMDCRFWRDEPCPDRPGPPVASLVLGVPSVAALLFSLGALAVALVRKLVARRRRKREEREARRARRKARRAKERARRARSAPHPSPSGG